MRLLTASYPSAVICRLKPHSDSSPGAPPAISCLHFAFEFWYFVLQSVIKDGWVPLLSLVITHCPVGSDWPYSNPAIDIDETFRGTEWPHVPNARRILYASPIHRNEGV